MTYNIDELLNKPYTNHGEFKVPEGYFDNLSQHIMDSIPEDKSTDKANANRKPLIIRMPVKVKYAVAACLTGLVVCGGVMTFNSHQQAAKVASAPTATQDAYTSEDYTRDCMDYAMVDDGDIYNYLADKD